MDTIHFIEKFIVYIEDHLRESIDFDAVLADDDIETKSFLTLFTSLVGMTPKEYQEKRQLTEIALEVYDGHRRLVDIIKYYNHPDLELFKDKFQKEFGISVYDVDKHINTIPLQLRVSFEIRPTTKRDPFTESRYHDGIRLIGITEFFAANSYNYTKKFRYLNYLMNSGIVSEILKHNNGQVKGLVVLEQYVDGDIQVFVGTPSNIDTAFETVYTPSSNYQIFESNGQIEKEIPKLYEHIYRKWQVKEQYDIETEFSIEVIKGLVNDIEDECIVQVWQSYYE